MVHILHSNHEIIIYSKLFQPNMNAFEQVLSVNSFLATNGGGFTMGKGGKIFFTN